ncbi:MAG TPA: hypothetical protein ENH43_02615 [Phycisphaerales bacterium]|nr:hypothetical protein [Phycisphaerales bacterium]
MLYISHIKITDICGFEDISLDLTNDNDDVVKVATILGDNGTGKTTILRSIVMGLCDAASSTGLLQELYGDFIRIDNDQGTIHVAFMSKEDETKEYWIKTTLSKTAADYTKVEQETFPDPFPWDDIFVCGYGAARGRYATRDYREYSVVDAAYSLFNYDSPLQNSELIIRRIKDLDEPGSNKVLEKLLNSFDKILMLSDGSVTLGREGLSVKGFWGKMPLSSLSDGYRATAAWLADFYGWIMFYEEQMFFDEHFSGIVLLDEIEQHLHPSWQRKIVRLLNQQFPKIQFIITTHSPLVAANVNKLFNDDFDSKLLRARYEENKSIVSEVEENLGELDVDQILSSEAFDLFEVNTKVAEVLREASELAAKDNKTPEEEERLDAFKIELKKIMFPEGRTLIERLAYRDYYSQLEEEIDSFQETLRTPRGLSSA